MREGSPMASEGPVRLALLPETARYSLRVRPAERAAASRAFGSDLPVRIGARIDADGPTGARAALCLGPDEWVLHTAAEDALTLQRAFAAIEAEAPHSLVDISDRECAIALSGDGAADLLATGCPRDVEAIPVGGGTRTVFDTVPVVLFRDGETDYRIEVWRSHGPHVWQWLNRANRELGAGASQSNFKHNGITVRLG
ncbi:MAG: sarcosine oxidase subunit gamma [Alphaproteobacteria bacterium]|nr:sarcosine oxidase subunit gamma [Alphaproteobacteria bacterium]MCB9930974.1 sarcosine oxidase subunit gamma [Alphaproteobacteria bacterium]